MSLPFCVNWNEIWRGSALLNDSPVDSNEAKALQPLIDGQYSAWIEPLMLSILTDTLTVAWLGWK